MLGGSTLASVVSHAEYTVLSDKRFKQNISENVHGLDFIMQLKPVTYNYDISGLNKFRGKDQPPTTMTNEIQRKNWQENMNKAIARKESIRYTGFLAQDVEEAAKKIGYDFSGLKKPQNNQDNYGLAYSSFVVPLVKAVQEQQKQIEELKLKADSFDELKKEIEELKKQVKACNY